MYYLLIFFLTLDLAGFNPKLLKIPRYCRSSILIEPGDDFDSKIIRKEGMIIYSKLAGGFFFF